MSAKMKIRTGDNVVVLSGKNKGKKGKILSVNPQKGKIIVEGVNVATKHRKPRKAGEPGGIIKQETYIPACKVMLVCGKCGSPTRVGRRALDNGDIVRYCKKCDVEI